MAGIHRLWLGLACALIAARALAAPLEAYGKLPNIEQVDISASGRELALIVTDGEARRIVVKDLAQKKVVYAGAVGSAKVRDIRWVGDDHLIIVTTATATSSTARGEFAFASDLDLATKTVRPLLRDVALSANSIIGRPVVRVIGGQPTLFLPGVSLVHGFVATTFRVDLSRGTSRPAEVGDRKTGDILIGADGEAVAQTLTDLRKWKLQVKTAAGWREVLTHEGPLDRPQVLGLGRDGRSVLVADSESDGGAWSEISLADGAVGARAAAAPGQSPIFDPISGRLIGACALVGDETRYTFFDAADARAWRAVEAAFAGDRVDLVSWSNDRTRAVVRVDSAKLGPAYALVDLTEHRAEWLGGEYQDLQPADISLVTPVRYKAADGFELSGYLTLPSGRAPPKGLPLIVFPHGGPAARDKPGFDWWAQAMASRGYAVLQVNFRGSTGFGPDYVKAGFGEWGRKMQTDLSDGVRYLAGLGTIDPKRVCIVGASYGGYAALAGATLDGGVYRCAVSFGGISDLRRMASAARDWGGRPAIRYWTRYTGADDVSDPLLVKYSPALQAANAYAPILLIHGKDDTVVPLEQSVEMSDALKRAGKPVEFILQNNSDHWLSLGETRLQMLQATMAFVEKHNPPK